MSSGTGQSKITTEKNKRILLDLASQPGNGVCADCKSRAPRWASHNLGIFICVRCASIHRKIGTHVTKVKSLTLDAWTKEQVETMSNMGNIKANSYWNPDEKRHPPPANLEESERDSELERFIRSKYEYQRFRSATAAATQQHNESRSSASLQSRSISAPVRSQSLQVSSTSTQIPSSFSQPIYHSLTAAASNAGAIAPLTEEQALQNHLSMSGSPAAGTGMAALQRSPQTAPHHKAALTSSTFNDLIQLQAPAANSSLPLQYQDPTSLVQSQTGSFASPSFNPSNPYATLSTSPTGAGPSFHSPFDLSLNTRSANVPTFGQLTAAFSSSIPADMSTGLQQPLQPFHRGMAATGPAATNPFHQYDSSLVPSSSPPAMMSNPFPQQLMQSDAFGSQNMAATITPPGLYQVQQPQQMSLTTPPTPIYPQATGGVDTSSPYVQQAHQAQHVFQRMPTSNPFSSQWMD